MDATGPAFRDEEAPPLTGPPDPTEPPQTHHLNVSHMLTSTTYVMFFIVVNQNTTQSMQTQGQTQRRTLRLSLTTLGPIRTDHNGNSTALLGRT